MNVQPTKNTHAPLVDVGRNAVHLGPRCVRNVMVSFLKQRRPIPFAVQRLLLSRCNPRVHWRVCDGKCVTTDNDKRVRRISDWDDIGRDTKDFTHIFVFSDNSGPLWPHHIFFGKLAPADLLTFGHTFDICTRFSRFAICCTKQSPITDILLQGKLDTRASLSYQLMQSVLRSLASPSYPSLAPSIPSHFSDNLGSNLCTNTIILPKDGVSRQDIILSGFINIDTELNSFLVTFLPFNISSFENFYFCFNITFPTRGFVPQLKSMLNSLVRTNLSVLSRAYLSFHAMPQTTLCHDGSCFADVAEALRNPILPNLLLKFLKVIRYSRIPSPTRVLPTFPRHVTGSPSSTFSATDRGSYLVHNDHVLQMMTSLEPVLALMLRISISVSVGLDSLKSITPSNSFHINMSCTASQALEEFVAHLGPNLLCLHPSLS